MAKRRQVKSWKSDEVPEHRMVMRRVAMRADTADGTSKKVGVVIASENPVDRWNEDGRYQYKEILDMDGVVFRDPDRRQLPIVDSHDRTTIRNVYGSVRNVEIKGSELWGEASFARDGDSQEAFDKLIDGHLTDFSITASPLAERVIRAGEKYKFKNQTIEGPAVIVTQWTPTDASLVASGADETSTVRSLLRMYQAEGIPKMDVLPQPMKDELLAQGMPMEIETLTDALAWAMGQMSAAAPAQPAAEAPIENEDAAPMDEPVITNMAPAGEALPTERADEEPATEREDQTEAEKAVARERSRVREIRALCNRARIERSTADSLVDSGASVDAARRKILERMMEHGPIGTSAGNDRVSVVAHEDQKFRAAARDGLIMRAASTASVRRDPFSGAAPAAGATDFRHITLNRLAEEILRRSGVAVHRMTSRDIAMAAMGIPSTVNRLISSGIMRSDTAYHTSGMFPQLLLDAANKTLQMGYDEAATTWELWARKAAPAPDLKSLHRIRFSESPDPEMIPEGMPYKEKKVSDAKESYSVEKYGAMFTVTWETIINDDMDAISRIPAMHGAASKRKVNKEVYAVLTDNAAMSDSIALFNASHSNLASSGAAISNTSLDLAYAAMMVQTGLEGQIINVIPRYLIVPAAKSATALQLVASVADPTAGGSNAGNSETHNLYGPGGQRPLTVIAEPQLDASSTTAWYLAAENSQVDTVEVSFLAGEESPVLENEIDFNTDTYKYKVRQTFGVKAIDWRGLYKNPGA